MLWKFGKYVFLLICPLSFSAAAGTLSPKNISIGTSVELVNRQQIFSNGLTAASLSKMYRGGFLEEEEKSRMVSSLKDLNHLFVSNRYGIRMNHCFADTILHHFSSEGFAGVYQRNFSYADFSKDAFVLMAYGNENPYGNSFDFSKTKLLSLNFQEFQVGYRLSECKSESGFSFSVSASALNMKSATDVFVSKGRLLTDTAASQVSLDANGNWWSMPGAGSPERRYFAHNGFGFSGHWEVSYKMKNKWFASLQMNDAGIYTFYRSRRYSTDTSLVYKGFYIDTYALLYQKNEAFTTDSLSRAFNRPFYQRVQHSLPVNFSLFYHRQLKDSSLTLNARITWYPLMRNLFFSCEARKEFQQWYAKAGIYTFFGMHITPTLGAGTHLGKYFLEADLISPQVVFIPGNTRSLGLQVRCAMQLPGKQRKS